MAVPEGLHQFRQINSLRSLRVDFSREVLLQTLTVSSLRYVSYIRVSTARRRYTQAANQLVLARRAMEAIPSPTAERKLATPAKRLAKKQSK